MTAKIEIRRGAIYWPGDERPAYSSIFTVGVVPTVGADVRLGPDAECHTVRNIIYTPDRVDLDAVVIVELERVWDGKTFVYPPITRAQSRAGGNMSITDAAVEAAAKSMLLAEYDEVDSVWERYSEQDREDFRFQARAALTAALPHMLPKAGDGDDPRQPEWDAIADKWIAEEDRDAALIRANKAEAEKAESTRSLIEHIAERDAALDRATRAEAALEMERGLTVPIGDYENALADRNNAQAALADVWDEALQAVAWAQANGPDAMGYARRHNPYRTQPETEEI